MNNFWRNVLAVIAGIIAGMALNMLLIMASPRIIPLPEGMDPTSARSIAEHMDLFQFKHFIMPFLAHALGTLAGAWIAVLIASSHKLLLAFIIGFLFLLGGISNFFQIPSPLWFIIVDLTLAYLPFAWLGYYLGSKQGKTIIN